MRTFLTKAIGTTDNQGPEIMVRRSSLIASQIEGEEYELAVAVIDYVNALTVDGCYHRHELPAVALNAVSAENYLGQVNNGGHRQFVLNAGTNYLSEFRDAQSALKSMSANEHAFLLSTMMEWTEQHYEQLVSSSEEFGPPPDFVDELDTKFYQLEERSPMAVLSARWIRSWPNLKVVDDAQYESKIQRVILSHPEYQVRLVTKRVHSLDYQMTDRLYVSMSLSATQCLAPEMLLRVAAGQYSRVSGAGRVAWYAKTTHGARYGIVSDHGVAFYEADENVALETELEDEIADMTGESGGRDLPEFAGTYLGKKLSEISAGQITEVAEAAVRFDAAAAMDLLLRKVGIDDLDVAVSALWVNSSGSQPASSRWSACVADRYFMLHVVQEGARLAESGGSADRVEASRHDIRHHRESLR
jgi:hypothetical protein